MEKESLKEALKRLPFAIPENQERYFAYAEKNPHMEADEIAWRVNNFLDFEKYTVRVPIENCHDICVLVNKYFYLPADFCPKELVEVNGMQLRPEAAEAFLAMRDAAAAEGLSLGNGMAYRSVSLQEEIFRKYFDPKNPAYVDETVARPQHSEHHTGLAIDVHGSIPGGRNIGKTPEGPWVRDNCHRFGFILRYPAEATEITGYAYEPWHVRYVGTQVSCRMKELGILTLEEYVARYL